MNIHRTKREVLVVQSHREKDLKQTLSCDKQITLTSTLIIPDITKTKSNNCFIIHCFKKTTTNVLLKIANRRDMFLLRRVRHATHHPST